MKQLLIILSLALSFTSCKKYEGNYQQVPDPVDTTSWQDGYQDGGVLPGGGTATQNPLVGTSWALTEMMVGVSVTTLNDTIHFTTNTSYYINSDSLDIKQYQYYVTQNLVTLTFHNFTPINAMSCTTNGLGVGFTVINGATFTYDYNSSQPPVKLWMYKL
jgi:hypothetical protein